MKNKIFKILIIIINIVGIICLIYFAIPYLRHDMSMTNPNAMLSSYTWDTCGFILTIGFIPLLITNILAYKFLDFNKKIKLLFFLPNILCLLLVFHYLLIATNWHDEEVKKPITSMKCSIDNKVYHYAIYFEENDEYSVSMDENDNIPLNVIDYTNLDTIKNSIEEYYQQNGGYCP